MLIIVCGLPGSGKSTLALALAKRLPASCISSDVVRKEMFAKPVYSDEEKQKVYDELATRAERTIADGKNAVVDATFYRKIERERMMAIAKQGGTEAYIILCTLHEAKAEQRMTKRKPGGVSDADFAIRQKVKGEFEVVVEKHAEIDSSLPLKERVAIALRFMGAG